MLQQEIITLESKSLQEYQRNHWEGAHMQVNKYVFQSHGDERGQLVALEEFRDIPFRIKRVYYMYDT